MFYRVKDAISSLIKNLREFTSNHSGNVAMMLALAIMALMLGAGAAIDYARIVNARTNLMAGLDASALYAAALTGKTEAEMKTLARAYLEENYTNRQDAQLTTFDLKDTGDEIEVTGHVTLVTWFMSVAGISTMDLPATSVVSKMATNVEVALVLDNTSSMGEDGKMEALKAAAAEFVDAIVPQSSKPNAPKVAVVPYSTGVNVGDYAEAVRGAIAPGQSATPGSQSFEFMNDDGNDVPISLPITTCVTERTGPNSYEDVPVSSNPVGRQYAHSVENPCLKSKIQPLTSAVANLKQSINAMKADGSSAGQVGIAWGWYVLSPNFGLWTGESVPAPYHDTRKHTQKIMVLMTDAEYNSAYCNGVISGMPEMDGSGVHANHIMCAATNGSSYTQSTAMCKAIKATGIEIYTIEFLLDTSFQRRVDLMNACATDRQHRIAASNTTELRAAFKKIAKTLLEMHLSR